MLRNLAPRRLPAPVGNGVERNHQPGPLPVQETRSRLLRRRPDLRIRRWNGLPVRAPRGQDGRPEVFQRQHPGDQQHSEDDSVRGLVNSGDPHVARFETKASCINQKKLNNDDLPY